MSRSETQGTPPSVSRRIINWVKRTPDFLSPALARADVWVQDHTVLATTMALAIVLTGTGLAVWLWGEVIIPLAKQYQPLFTIVWIVISIVLLLRSPFLARRAARLAAIPTESTVPTDSVVSTEPGNTTGTVVIPSPSTEVSFTESGGNRVG